MKLACHINHFIRSQKVYVADDKGAVVKTIDCELVDLPNTLEGLCSQYAVNKVYISGGINFTEKLAEDLKTRHTFAKNNIEIIVD